MVNATKQTYKEMEMAWGCLLYMQTLWKIVLLGLVGHSAQGWPMKTTVTYSVYDLYQNQGIKVDLEVEISFLPVHPPILYKI